MIIMMMMMMMMMSAQILLVFFFSLKRIEIKLININFFLFGISLCSLRCDVGSCVKQWSKAREQNSISIIDNDDVDDDDDD